MQDPTQDTTPCAAPRKPPPCELCRLLSRRQAEGLRVLPGLQAQIRDAGVFVGGRQGGEAELVLGVAEDARCRTAPHRHRRRRVLKQARFQHKGSFLHSAFYIEGLRWFVCGTNSQNNGVVAHIRKT